ncbi:MAG: DUF1549 domain-containing protein [Verrucomicrobia bacterium]|nr:DUF1549 domain-containing protein [Verrucomicrobiota bacterium]
MPPPTQPKRLEAASRDLLARWISEGAPWGQHWAFASPRSSQVPSGERHPVDAFVRSRLAQLGWKPSPQALAHTLIRRLSFDLTGLPPGPAEVEDFVQDSSEGAYNRLVDRLLQSPHFGERWARHWLDLARYADSDGYEKDQPRPNAYFFRDWVIRSINRDQPFDQFTVEQLAGDLLDHATDEQKIATGFHRQTLTNKEGGVDQEEFRSKAVVDRTHTTGAVWMGLTMGCAECHHHKYDPISQSEFYQFYSFFNHASEKDLPQPTPAEIHSHQLALREWQVKGDRLEAQLSSANTSNTKPPAHLQSELEKWRKAKPAFKPAAAPVFAAEHRPTHVHVRGDFLRRGEAVSPGVPAFLPPLATRGALPDRLDLARWLVSPAHPLTARVTVNQIWRQLFGRGLVATENDFGLRGDPPSHPELLDWLALYFQHSGWSRKKLIRLLVTSETYRQSSAWRADLQEQDPLNLSLARQARFRPEAEVVRDAALQLGGTLNPRIGGPSFKPSLPPDLAALSYASGLKWSESPESERARRSLYIHFQRTVPLPMLMTFDAPESNVTCTRRERSSTPLQALTLLNNESFVASARAFGLRLGRARSDPEARLKLGFKWATGRLPDPSEFSVLREFWSRQTDLFRRDLQSARLAAPPDTSSMDISTEELASLTALGRLLLNLDETLMRE